MSKASRKWKSYIKNESSLTIKPSLRNYRKTRREREKDYRVSSKRIYTKHSLLIHNGYEQR